MIAQAVEIHVREAHNLELMQRHEALSLEIFQLKATEYTIIELANLRIQVDDL